MGQHFARIRDLFITKEATIIIIGLDNAGKTTLVHKLKYNEDVYTVPTLGFSTEVLHFKKIKFTAIDLGGQDKIRPLWRHYFSATNAIIFVIDSNDIDRIEEAREELHKTLQEDELRNVPVLIFANKQDMKNAMPGNTMAEVLKLKLLRQEKIKLQECSALTGDGLSTGFEWLALSL